MTTQTRRTTNSLQSLAFGDLQDYAHRHMLYLRTVGLFQSLTES